MPTHEEMTWREFEIELENYFLQTIDQKEWRVEFQREVEYQGSINKRMDIHVARRRQGGEHYIIDAKHWRTPLPPSEITSTEYYRHHSRASKPAIIVVSQTTTIPPETYKMANDCGAYIFRKIRPHLLNFNRGKLDLEFPNHLFYQLPFLGAV